MAPILTTLRLRRWLRVTFWAFIGVMAAFAICVGYLTWTGGRALREATDELAREGETLDFRALLPDPVPDAENFCAIPLLKDIALYPGKDPTEADPSSRWKALENASLPRARPNALNWPGAERPGCPRISRPGQTYFGKMAMPHRMRHPMRHRVKSW